MGNYDRKQAFNNPYRLNSFRLEGLEKIEVGYRLINVSGLLEEDGNYEKQIRQLAIILSGSVKMPVEPIRFQGESKLAVTGLPEELRALAIKDKYSLTPDDVFTSLENEIYPLRFNAPKNRTEYKLARRALDWAIDNALKSPKAGWWKYERRFVSRKPLKHSEFAPIQIFPAFYFAFVPGADGCFELGITPSVCYAESQSTYEKYGQSIPASVKGKKFLYKNGTEFYPIDAVGIGKTAVQELMENPDGGGTISIQQRLKNRWSAAEISFIESLDENALTIAYKTKGQKSRRAHSQLLFELVGVGGSDEGDETPHGEAIMNADLRGRVTEQVIEQLSPFLKLFKLKLRPNKQMRKLNGEIRFFDAPKIRFRDDEELSTNLETMGRDRFDALKHLGAATSSDFDSEQLYLCGESFPEAVRIDFKKRFSWAVSGFYGKSPNLQNIRVNDHRAEVVRHHFNAFEKAIGNRRGYGLMILPAGRKPDDQRKLHDALKRRFWNQVQTQCASAETILSFYQVTRNQFGEEKWTVKAKSHGLYQSYLRYLALGFLEVNRKWLWKLGVGSLRNEVHVGIDVYQDFSVFTFVYGDADLVTFDVRQSKKGEKLSAPLIRETLLDNLRIDLQERGMMPSTIVFHRDGRVFRTEVIGIRQALKKLKEENLLAEQVGYAVVEIHKTSSSRPRLYRWLHNKFNNPEMGIFARLTDYEGILATTGAPLLRRGTAQPLAIELFEGNIDIDCIAADIYALSHLAFASPGSAMSLPLTIALADKILRESTPGKKTDLWEDEEDGETALEASVFTRYPNQQTRGGVAVL